VLNSGALKNLYTLSNLRCPNSGAQSKLQDFQRFLKAVSEILKRDDNLKIRQKVIRFLVHKINIIPDGFEVHFKVGESYVKVFLIKHDQSVSQNKKAQAVSEAFRLDLDKINALPDSESGNASQFLGHFSSNTCQSGAPGRT
jgi:hypothetical protein